MMHSYVEMYKEMHRSGLTGYNYDEHNMFTLPASETFSGISLGPHVFYIANFARNMQCKTALDYGCGKASLYKRIDPSGKTLQDIWGMDNISLYDPAVPEYEVKPSPCDLVVCTDVMEHIPESEVEAVLKDINMLANKAVYFCISYKKAYALLPNGENAHCTVKSEDWWKEQISKYIDKPFVMM